MGLDITAYEKVVLVEAMLLKEKTREADELGGELFVYYDGFEARGDGLVEGIYRTEGKMLKIPMGSYSGYNRWREELAGLLGKTPEQMWKEPAGDPFWELVNFADNDGFLGPVTCAKLARDFKEYEAKVGEIGDFARSYRRVMAGLEIAAGAGILQFH